MDRDNDNDLSFWSQQAPQRLTPHKEKALESYPLLNAIFENCSIPKPTTQGTWSGKPDRQPRSCLIQTEGTISPSLSTEIEEFLAQPYVAVESFVLDGQIVACHIQIQPGLRYKNVSTEHTGNVALHVLLTLDQV